MIASEAPRYNLPLQPTSFIGRDHELIDLPVVLEATRLLTLTGVGGVGETRLALALAERVAPSYPDGTWFVELAALAVAAQVPLTVATVVSVPLTPADHARQLLPRQGDLYYLPPGHTGVVENDFECIEFSPPAAHEKVLDVVKRNASPAEIVPA